MGEPKPSARPPAPPFWDRKARMQRRRERIREEIERNRRGEYTVPTWVLGLVLLLVVGGLAALVIFA
ncbi:MAG: hypothetical protein J2P15_02930 [Micromonosporaceae bacterium]|nr:hypothetical protein [Micromonosporaceae bacterium]